MLKMIFFDQAPYETYYGAGDCTYIRLPGGKHLLLDASSRSGGERIAGKLADMQVKHMDYFVASHLHRDHTEGFKALTETVSVGQILVSGYGYDSVEADRSFLEIAARRQIPICQVRMGDQRKVGDVNLEFLFPPAGIPEVSPKLPYVEQELNSNMYSLVLRMSYGSFSALFAGDIYGKTEQELVQIYGDRLKSTLLKIPHHGNDTSTGKDFLEAVQPEAAVVMCRSCEWAVQQRLVNAGVLVYGPFQDGEIVMETDGSLLQVECRKGSRTFSLA